MIWGEEEVDGEEMTMEPSSYPAANVAPSGEMSKAVSFLPYEKTSQHRYLQNAGTEAKGTRMTRSLQGNVEGDRRRSAAEG